MPAKVRARALDMALNAVILGGVLIAVYGAIAP